MSKRRTTGTATGRPQQYLDDDGRPPAPPEGGWLTSSIHSQAGGELIALLKTGLVEPDTNPSIIWKNWPNLRSVDPAVYRKFVDNCKRAAGIKTEKQPAASVKSPPRTRRQSKKVSFAGVSRTRLVNFSHLPFPDRPLPPSTSEPLPCPIHRLLRRGRSLLRRATSLLRRARSLLRRARSLLR